MIKTVSYILVFLFVFALIPNGKCANRFSVATGNWSATSTWSATSGGAPGASVPVAADVVYIEGAFTVTVDGTYTCAQVIFDQNLNDDGFITISGTNTLTVTGTLDFDPLSNGNIYDVNVNAGTLTVGGSVTDPATMGTPTFNITTGTANFTRATAWTWALQADLRITGTGTAAFTGALSISDAQNDFALTGGGTLAFNGGVTAHTLGTISNATIASTVTFNGVGYTKSGGTFTTMAGETINFGGNYTNTTPLTTFNATSTAIFTGTSTVTPTTAITFGNVQINSGITATLAGNITVAGNWTNNGGTLSGGATTVTFTGTAKTIGGTSGTAFPNLNIGTSAIDATISLTGGFTYSCVNFTIDDGAGGAATLNTLTHSGTEVLNVSGNATMVHPGAGQTNAWNINAGTATVTGTFNFTGTDVTVTRIAQVVVTGGALTVTGAVSWMPQPAGTGVVVTEVITVANGTITFGSSLSMPDGSGTLSVTGSGTINFNGAAAPSFDFFNGASAADVDPVFTTSANCILNFLNGFTNSNVALIITNGSTSVFTGSGTITPNAAITFGNVQINATPTVTLGGNISVTNNWTNLGGTLIPGGTTVTFNGTGTQTITKSVSPPEIFTNLTSNTTGPLTLGSNVTVTNLLTMTAGNYNLSTFILQLGNAAASTLTRTAGIMYNGTGGNFRRYWPAVAITSGSGNYYGLFPIGTSTLYRPVTINSTASPTGAGYMSASHTDAATTTDVSIPGLPGTVTRITDQQSALTNSAITGGTYNLDVVFSSLSATGAFADMRLVVPVTGGLGTHVAPTVTTIDNPTGERDALTIAQLANIWVIGTVNTTTTPLRQLYYSRKTGNWDDATVGNATWSFTSGGAGPSCDCFPAADGYAVINSGHIVTVAVAAVVDFVDINTGGTLNGSANFTVGKDMTTAGTGIYTPSTGIWTMSRNVTLNGTGTCNTTTSAMSIAGNLIVGTGKTLNMGAALTVTGNLTADGTLGLAGFGLTLNGGSSATISGAGNITTSSGAPSVTISTASKTISSGTALTIGNSSFPVTLAISGAITTTNQGAVTLWGDLTGSVAGSTWTNDAGSTLNITQALLATGTLDASTGTNTVNYNGSGAQTIKTPSSSYYNLTTSNAGTKSLAADVSVTNLATIQGAAILDEVADANDLTGAGGLTMTGTSELVVRNGVTATLPQLTGTYTLSAGTVTITRSAGTITVRGVTYYNLTLNGAGNHTCASVTSITNNFTVSSTADILSNGILTVGGAITYSSTDVDGWTLTNNVTAASLTMTAVAGFISAGIYTITINGAGGWTNNTTGLFDAMTGTVAFTGGAAQTIGGATATTFNNLTLNGAGGVTLGLAPAAATLVTGVFTLTNGLLTTTSANILQLEPASTVSGGSSTSFVNGPMINRVNVVGPSSRTFPTGKGTLYRPAVLTATHTDGTSVNYTGEVFNANGNAVAPCPCTFPGTIDRVSSVSYWQIDREAVANFTSATVNFVYVTVDDVSDAPNLRVVKTIGAGTTWNDVGGTGSGSPTGNITSASFASFSRFALGNNLGGGNPLPIDLLTFDAVLNGNSVNLKWETGTETNNEYFTIEKTKEGKEFTEVAIVKGAGTTSEQHSYSTIDTDPFEGTSYYRLKQTDFNKKFTYSRLVPINYSGSHKAVDVEFTVYPNPAERDATSVNISLNRYQKNKEVLVVLQNINGQVAYSKVVITGDNGSFVTAIDLIGQLAAGLYLVIGSSENQIFSRKLVVK